jgi:hypothetical protein
MDYLRQRTPPEAARGPMNYFLHMHFWGCGFYQEVCLIDQSVTSIFATGRDPLHRHSQLAVEIALNNRKNTAGQLRVTCLGAAANEFGL